MSGTSKKLHTGPNEIDYNRIPESKTNWQAFKDYIHNPDEGTYCGHTGKKWAITGTFYFCFFTVLALLFAVCMKGLLATINIEKPRWILEESLIGTNPGLGFRPISNNTDEKSLIYYSSSDPTSIQKWTSLLDTFLKEYVNSSTLPNGGRNQQMCNYDTPVKPGHVCAVEVNNWGPCSPDAKYSFNNSAPCVFIKLNRIYGWEPEYYNDTTNLPEDMPQNLVEHIKSVNSSTLNTVWLSCKGENPHDEESIGELDYYPRSQGFPGYYYPYTNIPGYLSPVIAVHFLRPDRNKIINVLCRAWAKNIKYSYSTKELTGGKTFRTQHYYLQSGEKRLRWKTSKDFESDVNRFSSKTKIARLVSRGSDKFKFPTSVDTLGQVETIRKVRIGA